METKAFLCNETQKKFREDFKRTGMTLLEMGYANGYVAVPPEHPLYGLHYDKVYDVADISVWGGLTFSDSRANCCWGAENIEMVGDGSFDDIPQNWWVFGFDTMHFNDGPEHDRGWCIGEVKQMQLQIEAIKRV